MYACNLFYYLQQYCFRQSVCLPFVLFQKKEKTKQYLFSLYTAYVYQTMIPQKIDPVLLCRLMGFFHWNDLTNQKQVFGNLMYPRNKMCALNIFQCIFRDSLFSIRSSNVVLWSKEWNGSSLKLVVLPAHVDWILVG